MINQNQAQLAREHLGLSLQVLASVLAVNKTTLQRWESGEKVITPYHQKLLSQILESFENTLAAAADAALYVFNKSRYSRPELKVNLLYYRDGADFKSVLDVPECCYSARSHRHFIFRLGQKLKEAGATVVFVPFLSGAYFGFLAKENKSDSSESRFLWASLQKSETIEEA